MLHDLTTTGKLSEKSVVVIGDIHGHLDLLDDTLLILMETGCQVVFVGDYIDRGDQGVEVVERVRSLVEKPDEWGLSRVTALMGNHERMFLDAADEADLGHLFNSDCMSLWHYNGGRREEYKALKNDHRDWLRTLPLFYEHPIPITWRDEPKHLVVCHASLEAGVPMEKQDPFTLVWDRKRVGYGPDYLTITGHTVCELRQPEVYKTPTGPLLRVDTGAAYGGPLSGVVLEEVDS